MLIVQKFGGTSVGSTERIQHVADRIVKERAKGQDIVVVLSAMGGETDRLMGLARDICSEPNSRELDALLATGEQVSVALLGIALLNRGCPAYSLTGPQAGIFAKGPYGKAHISRIDDRLIRRHLKEGKVVIVTGFQGYTKAGDVATLGRGGSDISAVALAAALQADECQIYTDVDGVYTTDPRIVPEARRLGQITYGEMLEMARLGAKVLHKRALELAGQYRIALRVLSTFVENPGTLITYDEAQSQASVSGVAFDANQALLSLSGVAEVTNTIPRSIHDAFSQAHIDAEWMVKDASSGELANMNCMVARDDYKPAYKLLNELAQSVKAKDVQCNHRVAKLSVIGVGMNANGNITDTLHGTLEKEGINSQLLACHDNRVSMILDDKCLFNGVRAVHRCFSLDKEAEKS